MTRPRPFQNPCKDRHLRHKNIEPSEEVKKPVVSVKDIKSPWLRRVLKRRGKK